MIICIDFDGTVVSDDRAYDDLATPLEFLPGAKQALQAMHRAGHILVLASGRANHALRFDWQLNPAWRLKKVPFDPKRWAAHQGLNQARYEQMLAFVERELPGVFAYVDDGAQGKVSADLFIDDKGYRFLGPDGWRSLAVAYGEE